MVMLCYIVIVFNVKLLFKLLLCNIILRIRVIVEQTTVLLFCEQLRFVKSQATKLLCFYL